MPELPEVEFVRRMLAPVMEGGRIARVDVNRPDLRTPFPRRFAARLSGQTVLAVRRRAKYLLVDLASGETLVMHLGMSGWFRVSAPTSRSRTAEVGVGLRASAPSATASPEQARGEADDDSDPKHDHVVFHMASGAAVTFNDPRRFGFMDLVGKGGLAGDKALSALGPEPLSDELDAATLARACAGKRVPLKAALLDQRIVAGLGNIYVVEALHIAGLSPRRRAAVIATSTGKPRDAAVRLVAAIKQVLHEAIQRQEQGWYRNSPFRVYDRAGAPCPRDGCTGTIKRIVQAGRSTFYCPICQR